MRVIYFRITLPILILSFTNIRILILIKVDGKKIYNVLPHEHHQVAQAHAHLSPGVSLIYDIWLGLLWQWYTTNWIIYQWESESGFGQIAEFRFLEILYIDIIINLSHFWPFLPCFTWIIGHIFKKSEISNLPESWFWLLLVNNSFCSIPPS